MSCIAEIPQAKALFALYEMARSMPQSVTDEEILGAIRRAYWITNASCAVSQIFSIIAPACLLWPHLTEHLIRDPIGAIIACGDEDPRSVVKAGAFLLAQERPYVSPDKFGAYWLEHVLPTLEPLIDEVFPEVLRECYE